MSIAGSEWARQVENLPRSGVMASVLEQVNLGNHISWPMVEIAIGDLLIEVASDVFAIGTETDLVRVPLDGPTAQAVADMLGCMLPTSQISDLIWKAASSRLPPLPMGPPQFAYDASMMSVLRWELHSHWIDQQLSTYKHQPGQIVAGHKKDVVLSNRLLEHPGRVAIYGWHRRDGSPIQGPQVSIVHVDTYYDYSHGIRLVSLMATRGGQTTDLLKVLRDPQLSKLLSREGPLQLLGYDEKPVEPIKIPAMIARSLRNDPAVVKQWQEIVGTSPTGQFDAKLDQLTKEWQRDHGLKVDGWVGTMTWRMALGVDQPRSEQEIPEIRLVQAKNYRPVIAPPRTVDLIVIHTMEAAEHPQTAENVAAWFASRNAPQASTHYNIDEDSIVQSVLEKDVAFCAPGTNHNGIHFEHAGYARQTAGEWQDASSKAILSRSAKLSADICQRHDIPLVFVDWKGLIKGKRGFTYHIEVSKACSHAQRAGLRDSPFFNHYQNKPKTNHGDPGTNFPIDHYLEMVKQYLNEEG